MQRRTLLIAGAASALALRRGAAAAPAPNEVRIAWPFNVGPLNPHLYSPNQMFAQAMLYEPLVRTTEGGAVVPWLARAWEISPDGLAYTFHLREGVAFSDGRPFDAPAVVANFAAILANRARHAWLALVEHIAGFDAPDPATFRLHLSTPYYPTLAELSLPRPLRFLSPAAIPADGNTAHGIAAPIGTGPWKLERSIPGEADIFVRNESYWGPRPALERVVVKVAPDPTSRALALQSGEIDLVYGTDLLDAEAIARLGADPRLLARSSPPIGSRLLELNSARFPTDSLAVRQAVQHAVDPALLVHAILRDAEPVAPTLFASNVPYADVGLAPVAHDPARAAALLDAAGWTLPPGGTTRRREGKVLAFDLCFVGPEAFQKAVAETVQGMLLKVGIAVRLVGEEPASFYARQKSGEFGMIFGDTWGPPYDPHAFLASMRAPSHADYQAQRGLPEKPEIDRRITAVLAETDEARRRAEYSWLLRTLHESAVYLPISYLTNKCVQSRRFPPMPFGPTQYEIPFEQLRAAS